jgi:hypothetical protein
MKKQDGSVKTSVFKNIIFVRLCQRYLIHHLRWSPFSHWRRQGTSLNLFANVYVFVLVLIKGASSVRIVGVA